MSAVDDILEASELELALVQLGDSPALKKAQPAYAVRYVEKAIALGETDTGGVDPARLEAEVAERGFVIERVGGSAPASRAGFHLCAITTADGSADGGGFVRLYVDEIAQKASDLRFVGLDVDGEALLQLHLAHELFHVLEFAEKGTADERIPRLEVPSLMGRKGKIVSGVREVSAHAFAARLVDGTCLPEAADLLQFVAEGSLSEEACTRRLYGARLLLERAGCA